MGVTGLWEYMQKFAETVPLPELARKKMAVDGTAWIVDLHKKGCASQSTFFQRTCRVLELAIEPVFVFDTAKTIDFDSSRAPARRSNGKRTRKADNNNRLLLLKELDEVKALLEKMDIRTVDAACDSVAQCADMEQRNIIDGCVTRDMNYFLFGGKNMYHIDFGYKLVSAPDKVFLFSMDMISETQGLNRNRLIALAILLGCDSYERGIQRVGMVTGLEIIAEFSLVDDDHPQTILDRFRSYCSHELESSDSDSEMKAKLYKSGFSFPSCFPNSDAVGEAINSYLIPSVNTVTNDDCARKLVDPPSNVQDELEDYVENLFKWEKSQVKQEFKEVYEKREKILERMPKKASMTPPLSSSSMSSADSAIELTESIVSNSSSGSRSRYRPLVCDKSVSEDDGIYCSKREFTALEALKKKMSLYSDQPLILEASLRGGSGCSSSSESPSSSSRREVIPNRRRRPFPQDTIDSSPAPKISRDELTTIEATSHQPSIIIDSFHPGKPSAVC
ncbi:hypothetical protein L596_024620 [Steinernema carpocapsae]|uniref:XPG N-terminal domain-containing protein n=1 Tax=Steinernema carpocapsae TaxID=34508 RepID=A0A4U5M670_STECR|nr:hypothetical protein L596_024620 [Steinernema carpocapsae]